MLLTVSLTIQEYNGRIYLSHLPSGSQIDQERGQYNGQACWSPPVSCWSGWGTPGTGCLTKVKQRLFNNSFYFSTFCYCRYLFICVDVFVESLEGIDVELHKLPEQVKVALQNISGLAAAVDDAEEDVLQSKDKIWATQSILWGKTFWPIRQAQECTV